MQGGADPQHRLHEAVDRERPFDPRRPPRARQVGPHRAMAHQGRHQRHPDVGRAAQPVNQQHVVARSIGLDGDALARTEWPLAGTYWTGLLSVPMPSIWMRTRSPRRRNLGGSKPMPTPDRRAGGDDVARVERDAGRDGRDQGRDVEDQVLGRRVLAQLVVDPAAHAGVRAVELVGAGEPRPHRREGVERLAQKPLLVAALQVARRHVVDDGVAPDMLHGARRSDGGAGLADHDRELGFVVDRRGETVGDADRRLGRDHAFRHLGEDDREFRHDLLRRALATDAAVGEFRGMGAIVETDAEDIAPRHGDRRVELDGRQGQRRAGWLGHRCALGHRLDERQRAHVVGAISERKRRHIAFVGAQPSDMPPSRPPKGSDLQTFPPDRRWQWPTPGPVAIW